MFSISSLVSEENTSESIVSLVMVLDDSNLGERDYCSFESVSKERIDCTFFRVCEEIFLYSPRGGAFLEGGSLLRGNSA